jgi:hypothetical protein
VNAGAPEHAGSPGPKTAKVTVPVGPNPPETIAVSDTAPPTKTGPDACVTTAGDARDTTTDSPGASHCPITEALAVSPE